MEPFHLKHVHKQHPNRSFLPFQNKLFMSSALLLSLWLCEKNFPIKTIHAPASAPIRCVIVYFASSSFLFASRSSLFYFITAFNEGESPGPFTANCLPASPFPVTVARAIVKLIESWNSPKPLTRRLSNAFFKVRRAREMEISLLEILFFVLWIKLVVSQFPRFFSFRQISPSRGGHAWCVSKHSARDKGWRWQARWHNNFQEVYAGKAFRGWALGSVWQWRSSRCLLFTVEVS